MDTKNLLKEIEKEIVTEAKLTFLKNGKEAVKDSRAFLAAIEEDLKRWSLQLAEGSLSQDGFISLVKGDKDLAEMHALKQKGISRIMLNEFQDRMIGIIIDRTIGLLG